MLNTFHVASSVRSRIWSALDLTTSVLREVIICTPHMYMNLLPRYLCLVPHPYSVKRTVSFWVHVDLYHVGKDSSSLDSRPHQVMGLESRLEFVVGGRAQGRVESLKKGHVCPPHSLDHCESHCTYVCEVLSKASIRMSNVQVAVRVRPLNKR